MLYVITYHNSLDNSSYFIGVADNQLLAIKIMHEDIKAQGTNPNNYAITSVKSNVNWAFNIADEVADQYDADGE